MEMQEEEDEEEEEKEEEEELEEKNRKLPLLSSPENLTVICSLSLSSSHFFHD